MSSQSRVIEIGSGTGDLLIRGADKLCLGVGVDLDVAMVKFANQRAQGKSNIQFKQGSGLTVKGHFDIATASLCLHALPFDSARDLLAHMLTLAPTVLIADFIQPPRFIDKLTLEIDELISGHYLNYCRYKQAGGMPSLANDAGAKIVKQYSSSIACVSIWQLEATST